MYEEIIIIKAGVVLFGLGCLIYCLLKTEKALKNPDFSTNSTKENGKPENCLLCLKEFAKFKKIVLPCQHKFHKECISLLFKNEVIGKRQCPSCLTYVSENFIKSNNL